MQNSMHSLTKNEKKWKLQILDFQVNIHDTKLHAHNLSGKTALNAARKVKKYEKQIKTEWDTSSWMLSFQRL